MAGGPLDIANCTELQKQNTLQRKKTGQVNDTVISNTAFVQM